jgi:hypothetical protein
MSSTKSTWLIGPGTRSRMAVAQAEASLCVGQRTATSCSPSAQAHHNSSQRQRGKGNPSSRRCRVAMTASGTNSGRMYSGSRERAMQKTSRGSNSHRASSSPAASSRRPSRVRSRRILPGRAAAQRSSDGVQGSVPIISVGR